MRAPTIASLLSLPFALIHAANLTLAIPPSQLLANPSTLPPSTHATLLTHHHSASSSDAGTGSERIWYDAPLTRRNTFEFRDVAPGSYLLDVHCRDFVFEGLRIDVGATGDPLVGADGEAEAAAVEGGGQSGGKKEDGAGELVQAWTTFRGHEWENKGEKRGEGRGSAVVDVRVLAGKEFYQARGGFSLLSLLKSPMILMALFSLVLIVGMPYLMENMDDEDRAAFEEMQRKSPLAAATNPAASLQNFDLASWMAGKSGQEAASSAPASGTSRRRG